MSLGVCVALALAVSLFTTSPAMANAINHSLPAAGHTCIGGASGFVNNEAMCVEVGVYTSSSGAQAVTAQIETWCSDSTGAYIQCTASSVFGEIANGSGNIQQGSNSCSGNCLSGQRNYFFPLGGLPISAGKCDNNVWAVLLPGTEVDAPHGSLTRLANLATPHFNVCESSTGAITFSKIA